MAIFKNENGTAVKKSGSSPNFDDNFAHVEPSVTSSQAYNVGQYLVYSGHLYRVISAISQGDTLSVNSNIELTNVTDEFENISSQAEEVEWSVWNAMTEAEKDAYSAGKKIDIVNIPGADGTISADLMDLLWTNPSPTAEFAPQTIALDLSGYDYVFVVYKWNYNSNGQYSSGIYPINGVSSRLSNVGGNTASTTEGTYAIYRDMTVSQTGVVFDLSFEVHTGSAANPSNTYVIPMKIYGIKTSINLKFDAIATDVSTSADKCMLSDGVTSVGDVIDKGVAEVVCDGVKTVSAMCDELFALIDFTKIEPKSILRAGNGIAQITAYTDSSIVFTYTEVGSSVIYNYTIVLLATGSRYTYAAGTTITNKSTEVWGSGTKIALYY